MLNTNITKADAGWLLNFYKKEMTHSYLDYKRLAMHKLAQELIRGHEVFIPECKCNYGAFQQISISLFEQYEEELKKIVEDKNA